MNESDEAQKQVDAPAQTSTTQDDGLPLPTPDVFELGPLLTTTSQPSLACLPKLADEDSTPGSSRELEVISPLDLDFTMASDLGPPDFPPYNLSTTHAVRPRNAQSIVSSSYSDDAEESQIEVLRELLPLFPLPPSSIPIYTPKTPSPLNARNSHAATPTGPPRHHWVDADSDEESPYDSPSTSRKMASSPEVVMVEDTPPPRPAKPTSSSRRRQGKTNRAKAAAEKVNAPSSSDSDHDNTGLPFDADSLDADIVLATEGSWRRVQGDPSVFHSKGMAPIQRSAWNEIDDNEPVLAIQIPNHGAKEPGTGERVASMSNFLRHRLRIPHHSITSSYSVTGFHGMNTEPFWYLVQGLSIYVILELVRLGYLNSPDLTLYFDFWRDYNPHLCATFRLIHRFGAQTKAEYEEVIRREFIDSDLYDKIFDILTRDIDRDGMWRNVTRVDALTQIIDSVEVDVFPYRTSGATSESVAVVYIKPPTADRRDWLNFCSIIRGHDFGSSATGSPEIYLGRIWCSYCHSLGHTAGRCTSTESDAAASPRRNLQQQRHRIEDVDVAEVWTVEQAEDEVAVAEVAEVEEVSTKPPRVGSSDTPCDVFDKFPICNALLDYPPLIIVVYKKSISDYPMYEPL
ncbi:hypothetical protein EVJ58_g9739 [Rhodofomes roseus]|uniref:Uncharacterized protein n=1 Tax=Rhodofomes roseus TaxID=34475 RepID=A0A4Y9XT26_9APHY|nr:hypothetical protein EVJ58_g9739 [Rhodofomes roseus]